MRFRLRFLIDEIENYTSRYSYGRSELKVIEKATEIRNRGYLSKKELKVIGYGHLFSLKVRLIKYNIKRVN